MKHRPTDEELRRAVAILLGWQVKEGTWGIAPDGNLLPLPDYPNDRNALPELLQAVVARNEFDFMWEMGWHGPEDYGSYLISEPIEFLLTPPRTIVVACLKALGAYKPEWDEDTQEETQT